MGFLLSVAEALWTLAVLIVEGVLWARYVWKQGTRLLSDAKAAHAYAEGAPLRCPRGHEVPTEGTYECSACHYTYQGSIWLCPGPTCQAPVAPYCVCPACGLSIPNPARLGGGH